MKLEINKKLFLPAMIIAVGMFSLMAVFLTQVKVIRELRASVKQLRSDRDDLKSRYLMLSSLDQEDLKRQSALAELAIPSEKNIPFVLQAFRDAVSEAEFLIKKFEFDPGEISKEKSEPKKAKRTIEEMPLSANLIGPADNLDSLIDSLQNTFPLFEVEVVNFTVTQQQNKAQLELEAITFYSPPLIEVDQELIKLDQLKLSEEERALLGQLENYSRPELKRAPSRGLERKSDNPFVF